MRRHVGYPRRLSAGAGRSLSSPVRFPRRSMGGKGEAAYLDHLFLAPHPASATCQSFTRARVARLGFEQGQHPLGAVTGPASKFAVLLGGQHENKLLRRRRRALPYPHEPLGNWPF
ncbi:hypothetical protein WDJ50_11995 [Deinococcus sp. VB142]|uniref:Uncharacterized protein n=1 Tax=Deinococcus sp. VB142 TaxID=3112952 RepID=A0AAU6Q1A2_9DEIO